MALVSAAEFKTKIDKIIDQVKLIISSNKKIKKSIYKNCTFNINVNTNVVPYVTELIDIQKTKYLNNNNYFTREDLIPEIADLAYPPQKYEKILRKLKRIIPDEDFGAILYAAMICKKEDKNVAEIEVEKDKRNLYTAKGHRGITLYNWLRSGDVFPQDIFPLVDLYTSKNINHALFIEFWNTFIKQHPYRIFISRNMTKNELKTEIIKRIKIENQKQACVYSRRSKNQLADTAVKEIFKENKNFRRRTKNYTIGKYPAKRIKIIPKT